MYMSLSANNALVIASTIHDQFPLKMPPKLQVVCLLWPSLSPKKLKLALMALVKSPLG